MSQTVEVMWPCKPQIKLTAPHSISHLWSLTLECCQSLSKLTNQRVYQMLVYQNNILLNLLTGVLPLTLTALFPYFVCSPFFMLCPNWLNARKRLGKYRNRITDIENDILKNTCNSLRKKVFFPLPSASTTIVVVKLSTARWPCSKGW